MSKSVQIHPNLKKGDHLREVIVVTNEYDTIPSEASKLHRNISFTLLTSWLN